MSDDNLRTEVTNLRAEIERRFSEAEERQKARDPNVISAVRTLAKDIQEYVQGKRVAFPNEALVGVFSAYLRPRIVLIFGSIVATMVAAGEFYLIYQQNAIIERQTEILADQNELIEQQARFSRAEVASALLPALQEAQPLPSAQSQFALAAYGDVVFDVLLPVLRLGLPHPRTSYSSGDAPAARNFWLNAMDIVIERKEFLAKRDKVDLLFVLIEAADASRLLAMNHASKESPSQSPLASDRSEIDPAHQDAVLYRRLCDQIGLYLYDLPGLELSDSEWRRALDGIARMFSFAHRYRFDQYATSWVEQAAGVLGTSVRETLCPRAWSRLDDPENIIDYPSMLLLEAFPTSTPNGRPGLEKERAIQAVMLFACAPHLLNPNSPEDAKIIVLAKAALPFINHESIQEGERQP